MLPTTTPSGGVVVVGSGAGALGVAADRAEDAEEPQIDRYVYLSPRLALASPRPVSSQIYPTDR